MTDEERTRLLVIAETMRHIPDAHVGPLREWWDGIAEIERAIDGGRVIFSMTPQERIAEAEATLMRLGYPLPARARSEGEQH